LAPWEQLLQSVLVNRVPHASGGLAASNLMRLGHGWIVLTEAMPTRLGEALGQDRSASDLRIIRQEADAISAGQQRQWHHHRQRHHAAEIAHGRKPQTTTNVAGLEKP
tara:strand:+ start:1314 stop:1637 length:324 start_codon:yes stop_codon:yes gene_type:complete